MTKLSNQQVISKKKETNKQSDLTWHVTSKGDKRRELTEMAFIESHVKLLARLQIQVQLNLANTIHTVRSLFTSYTATNEQS